jgi:hypothetical protein
MTKEHDEMPMDDDAFSSFAVFRGREVDATYSDQTVPSYSGNPLIEALPQEFADDQEAAKALLQRPDFSPQIRLLPPRDRIHCVGDLEDQFFQPLSHHLTLQLKLSRMIRRSYVMRNPITPGFYRHVQQEVDSVPSFTAPLQIRRPKALGFNLIGPSGIGKSYSLESMLFLYPQVIKHRAYQGRRFTQRQLTWLKLDCPYDGSPRGLGRDFLQAVDDLLGTNYTRRYQTARSSVDDLLRAMARVAGNHVLGALIIDEIQVLRALRGDTSEKLLNFFVTLVNTIGVPVLLVGTDKARTLFESKPRQARRGTGQGSEVWSLMRNDATWQVFLTSLFRYQYVQQPVELTEELRTTFFDETQGITDVVVKLYVQSQIRAIRTGHEQLTPDIVRSVALDSFQMLRPVIIALRNGDKRALAELEDIYPFWREEYARLAQKGDQPIQVTRKSDSTPQPAHDEGAGALELLEQPESMVLHDEQSQNDSTPITPQRASRSRRGKKASYPATSLMGLIKQGKTHKLPPYQTLKEAGYIFSFDNYLAMEQVDDDGLRSNAIK